MVYCLSFWQVCNYMVYIWLPVGTNSLLSKRKIVHHYISGGLVIIMTTSGNKLQMCSWVTVLTFGIMTTLPFLPLKMI